MGWVPSARPGNDAAVGNTIEELLEIEENNLPLPNAGEWEIKAQRLGSKSLTTLIHSEPSPTAIRFVPQILLPKYGAGLDKFFNVEANLLKSSADALAKWKKQ